MKMYFLASFPMLVRGACNLFWEYCLILAEFIVIYYSWRPTSPDAGDDLVVDCAMNAGAVIVTYNIRDFLSAKDNLGVQIMTPTQFVNNLELGGDNLL